ncbi:cyclase family protein [Variovorax sp. J31P207]|uniref:cyclase family protein n=1 Tax=Variovorax sp. J31P207 TaxID=3053510 RepID=UPI002575E60B|nr:cyclase family protein [Variovorax sp. J31P207]MDM0069948.1 cyclase family protein [Variovorax sp. J31P207]
MEDKTSVNSPNNAWGRWGPEDEAGALNLIGAAQVKRAAGLVRTGEVIRLAQPLSHKTPVPRHRSGLQHFMGRDGGDYAAGARRPGGFQFAEDTVIMPLHIGTHIDALCHAWCEEKMFNGYRETTMRSTSGATRLGVEKMPPAFTRGLLIDLVELRGRPMQPGEVISREDLQACLAVAGLGIEPGDAVLLHTGWLQAQAGNTDIDFNSEPGIDHAAGFWLAQQDVAIIGADNFAVEVLPFAEGTVFPVHQCVIRDFGIPLLEGLMLEPLVRTGRKEFLFVGAALPIVGATGSPLTPLAVL